MVGVVWQRRAVAQRNPASCGFKLHKGRKSDDQPEGSKLRSTESRAAAPTWRKSFQLSPVGTPVARIRVSESCSCHGLQGARCRGAGRPFAFVGSALRIHRKAVRFKNLASTPRWTDSTARPPADSGPLGPPQASQHPPASPFQCPALRETHGRHPRVAPTSPGWAPAANTPD